MIHYMAKVAKTSVIQESTSFKPQKQCHAEITEGGGTAETV